MAIAEALLNIEQDWNNLEPRLTVRELFTLADITTAGDVANPDLAARVLGVLAAALDRDHPAWDELRRSATRYATVEQQIPLELTMARLRDHTASALRRDTIADDAAADAIEDLVLRSVLQYGVTAFEPDYQPHELLIGIAIVNQITQLRYPFETSPLRQVPLLGLGQTQRIYPVFQFAPNTGPEPRPEVLEVNRRLDIGQDPLGAASWWLSPNSWLDAPPAALLGTVRADEINYAAEQLDSDSW